MTQNKTDVQYSGDGTKVDYRLGKQMEFVPDLSNGMENDTVHVPNIAAVVRIVYLCRTISNHVIVCPVHCIAALDRI